MIFIECLVDELHFAEVSWFCFGGFVRVAHSDADHWGVAFAETELCYGFRGVSEEADRAAETYGADSEGVSRLRLWKARSIQNFNMGLFSQGQYARAMEEATNADAISKVLYPSDDHDEGKLLRLSQQYFMVSASCQSIIRDHMAVYGTLDNLADKVAGVWGYWLVRLNPLALYLNSMRDVLLYSKAPNLRWLALWTLVGILLSFAGIRLIQKNENSYVKVL